MSASGWVHLDDTVPMIFPDRRSADLIGTDDIPTSSDFKLGVAWYTGAEFGELQTHADQEALYVAAGEGELWVGNRTIPLKPGTAVYIPPGTPHAGRQTSDDPVLVVYCHGAV